MDERPSRAREVGREPEAGRMPEPGRLKEPELAAAVLESVEWTTRVALPSILWRTKLILEHARYRRGEI